MMHQLPTFPSFKPIELDDRPAVTEFLRTHQPGTSELTFTNLFIWRRHYDIRWSVLDDRLCIIGKEGDGPLFGMAPVGPPGRIETAMALLRWLKDETGIEEPVIERADESLAGEASDRPGFVVEERREHFDYVYRTSDLIQLPGNRNRTKRNHINQFLRVYGSYEYEHLEDRHIGPCIALQEKWCQVRRCREDLNLLGEWDATKEILINYRGLDVTGGVIRVNGEVAAFTVGEAIGDDTAVIHIEKADPQISGLYQLINQQFCLRQWPHITFINREQDLGIPGLREAKLSYNPDHFVKKYRIILKGRR